MDNHRIMTDKELKKLNKEWNAIFKKLDHIPRKLKPLYKRLGLIPDTVTEDVKNKETVIPDITIDNTVITKE